MKTVKIGIALIAGLFILPLQAYAATPDTGVKIMLIGDSLSSGYGLSGAGWVEQLNQQYRDSGDNIEIINDSISGDTTAGGVARVREGLSRIRPDWLLIELGGNDGLRGVSPKVISKNLLAMVNIAQAEGIRTMLLGIRMPPNYGKAYTEKFEQTFEQVSEATDSPLLPFFIGEVGGDPELNQPDMIHPNDEAQPIIRDRVKAFLDSVLNPG
ncbi:MAG: arylesterase [Granulosicoccus sp.]|nr:arylesterase [Granulosicoccus sp.]